MPNEARVLSQLLETPQAKAIADADAKKIAKARTELAARREEIEAHAETRHHQFYGRDLPKLLAAVAAAQDQLKAAKAAQALIAFEKAAADHAAATELQKIESQLTETAHPAIDTAVAQLRDLLDVALKTPVVESSTTVINQITGKRTTVAGRPLVTPAMRAQAIRSAIAEAMSFKLQPDQSGVPARLEEIRTSLPQIGSELSATSKKDQP